MTYIDILQNHKKLSKRRASSLERLGKVREEFEKEFEGDKFIEKHKITIFCAGSLARLEVGGKSDLDIFMIEGPIQKHSNSENSKSMPAGDKFFDQLTSLNKALKFPPFSNDGEYLKIHSIETLKEQTGSRQDDSENQFTARMLLLLESEHIIRKGIYNKYLKETVEHYYRDGKGKKKFKPLFLLNDLLRYWRTLCLNYEEGRQKRNKPWREKNINLKFSRRLTVFATILPLVVEENIPKNKFLMYCKHNPLERLAKALDKLDNSLEEGWKEFLDSYETFLSWKEDGKFEEHLRDNNFKSEVNSKAKLFRDFLYKALMHEKIDEEYKKYLVL